MANVYIKDVVATAPNTTDKIPVSNGGSLPKVVTVQSILDMLSVKSISNITRTSGDSSAGTVDTYTITYSGGTTSTFQVRNGADGAAGAKGDTGATGSQGPQGVAGTNGTDGVSIVSITQTAGNHAPGTTDTYTITLSNSATVNFTVYNGLDGASGSGSGDMLKATYDSDNDGKVDAAEVADAVAWVGIADKPSTYPPATHNHDSAYAPVLGADDNYVTDTEKIKLSNLSGTNTGDQDLSGYSLTSHNHTGIYAPVLGSDDNYVTDVEKAALHSHSNKTALDSVSGTNTGDQDLSGYAAKAVANTFTKTQTPSRSAVSPSAAIDWDASTVQVLEVTLTATRLFNAPTNLVAGTYYAVRLIGAYVPTWNTAFKNISAYTSATTATKADFLTFYCSDGTNLELVGIMYNCNGGA